MQVEFKVGDWLVVEHCPGNRLVDVGWLMVDCQWEVILICFSRGMCLEWWCGTRNGHQNLSRKNSVACFSVVAATKASKCSYNRSKASPPPSSCVASSLASFLIFSSLRHSLSQPQVESYQLLQSPWSNDFSRFLLDEGTLKARYFFGFFLCESLLGATFIILLGTAT